MPNPNNRTRLSYALIVEAAIEIADAGGLDALTMRSLADELGVGAMSLYRYVDDKGMLIQAMTLEITRRHPYPRISETPWYQRVLTAVEIDWALYNRHQWLVLALASPRTAASPESEQSLAWLASAFVEAGTTPPVARATSATVWNLVAGTALTVVAENLVESPDCRHRIRQERWDSARELLDIGIEIICVGAKAPHQSGVRLIDIGPTNPRRVGSEFPFNTHELLNLT